MTEDVPVTVDFRNAEHAREWTEFASRVQFVERNLRELDWHAGLGRFDAVLTHQVVHELRHKRYARTLHAQVRSLLKPGAGYLVCDHFLGEGGMTNDQLYMSIDEQRQALLDAGFAHVTQVMAESGLVLHRAT